MKKVISINILLSLIFPLIFCEIWLRLLKPKAFSWTLSKSYPERLSTAIKSSTSKNELILAVGDSFAAHQIGTNGNFLDISFNCNNQISCNYFNIAKSGEYPSFYWESIWMALQKRNPNYKNRIYFTIYYGNDLSQYIRNVEEEKYQNAQCSITKFDPNFLQKEIQEHDTLKIKFKRTFPSINLIVRGIKSSLSPLFYKLNPERLIKAAEKQRKDFKLGNDSDIKENFKRLNYKLILKTYSDRINPWEVSLALAEPKYYTKLYSLESNWSKYGIKCLKEDIKINVKKLKKKYPNTEFIFIGIPDKLFWSEKIDRMIINDYEYLGYNLDPILNQSDNKVPKEYYSLQENMNFFFKENNLKYVYLPSLLDNKSKIYELFYQHDMHINAKGNKAISLKLIQLNK